jgi:hypothetical protein
MPISVKVDACPRNHHENIRETQRAASGLLNDLEYERRSLNFRRDMVYGEALEYAETIAIISDLANRLPE